MLALETAARGYSWDMWVQYNLQHDIIHSDNDDCGKVVAKLAQTLVAVVVDASRERIIYLATSISSPQLSSSSSALPSTFPCSVEFGLRSGRVVDSWGRRTMALGQAAFKYISAAVSKASSLLARRLGWLVVRGVETLTNILSPTLFFEHTHLRRDLLPSSNHRVLPLLLFLRRGCRVYRGTRQPSAYGFPRRIVLQL